MSRLRRPFLYDRYIFVTVDLLRGRGKLQERDFGRLAIALGRMRQKQRLVLTAWVFLPDHWHAIIYPPHPVGISRAMRAVKVSSMMAINHGRHEKGELGKSVSLRSAQGKLSTMPCGPCGSIGRRFTTSTGIR